MGDWDKAIRRFEAQFKKEEDEVARLISPKDSVHNEPAAIALRRM
jgi:hypothetical protein